MHAQRVTRAHTCAARLKLGARHVLQSAHTHTMSTLNHSQSHAHTDDSASRARTPNAPVAHDVVPVTQAAAVPRKERAAVLAVYSQSRIRTQHTQHARLHTPTWHARGILPRAPAPRTAAQTGKRLAECARCGHAYETYAHRHTSLCRAGLLLSLSSCMCDRLVVMIHRNCAQ
jgi:hypothetical protein